MDDKVRALISYPPLYMQPHWAFQCVNTMSTLILHVMVNIKNIHRHHIMQNGKH